MDLQPAIDILQSAVDSWCTESGLPRHILVQDGAGISGLPWLNLHVRQAKISRPNRWWSIITDHPEKTTVLMYRSYCGQWKIRMHGLLDAGRYYTEATVEIGLVDFLCWFEDRLDYEMQRGEFIRRESNEATQYEQFQKTVRGIMHDRS